MSKAGTWDASPQNFYRMMVETLRLLAAPAEMQITLFPEYVDIPGEIAQLSDDLCYLLGQIRDAGLISAEQAAEFRAISDLFSEMPDDGPGNLWTTDAMKGAPEWTSLRERSRLLLADLGARWCMPQLYWFRFQELDAESAARIARILPELDGLVDSPDGETSQQ